MQITTDEIYTICNALNSHANELERDAQKRRRQGHTFQQIEVVEEEVRRLRDLSARLIADNKKAA